MANNGGQTETHLPGPSSPTLNVIPQPTGTTLTDAVSGAPITLCSSTGGVDQRGVARPDGAACDIGSVEAGLVAPVVSGPSDVTFAVGTANSFNYTTLAIPAPATLTLTGTLPAGISFTDNGDGTGVLAGTAAVGAGGTYSAVVHGDNGVAPGGALPVTIHVTQAPSISGPSSAIFVAGRNMSVTFSSAGVPTPTIGMTGTLPTGITFTPTTGGGASLTGNAPLSAAGTYALTLQASNGTGTPASLAFTLIVNPPVSIATSAPAPARVGVSYSAQLVADGGLPPYSWLITSGSLPAGLMMAGDGSVSGTPTVDAVTKTFTVRVADSLNPAGSVSRAISITIDKGPSFLDVRGLVLRSSGKITTGRAEAKLTGGSPAMPLAGKTVVFTVGNTTVCKGITGTDGNVVCDVNAVNTAAAIARGGLTATFAGDAKWLSSSGKGGIIS